MWDKISSWASNLLNKQKPAINPSGAGWGGSSGFQGGVAGQGGGGGGGGASWSTAGPTPTGVPEDPNKKIVNSQPWNPGSVGGASTYKAAQQPEFNLEQIVADQQAKERAQMEQLKLQQQKGIGASFDPIFSELDRQLSTLPTQKVSYEQQLANLADAQLAGIKDTQATGEQNLERAKSSTRDQAQTSLRDLEGDVRNQLQAGAKFLGTRGAGDSSAAGALSEAITREGMKARTGILSVQDRALGEIEAKLADVKTLAGQEARKVDEWKSTKLFELGQFFSEKINELNMQKANATADQQRAITEMIGGLEQDFIGRLRQLDDSVINYKTSIATWQMQRQAEMEDYAKKLAMGSSYSGGEDNSKAMKMSLDAYNDAISKGMSAATARQIATNLTGIDPQGKAELTDADLRGINFKRGITEEEEKGPGLWDRIKNIF